MKILQNSGDCNAFLCSFYCVKEIILDKILRKNESEDKKSYHLHKNPGFPVVVFMDSGANAAKAAFLDPVVEYALGFALRPGQGLVGDDLDLTTHQGLFADCPFEPLGQFVVAG